MSQEINGQVTLSVNSGGGQISGTVSFLADLSANGFIAEEVSIGTSAATLDVGGVTAPKAVFIKNLDPTNYIQVDSASTMDKFPQKIQPGQGLLLLPQSGTIYAKANTAACMALVVVA